MPAEIVMDASVAVKCLVAEEGSEEALAVSLSGAVVIAPDFVHLELASVLSKKVRRREIPKATAAKLLESATALFDATVPAQPHLAGAFEFAADFGLSAYDGLYVALAEARGSPLVTADLRLVARARDAGLGHIVRPMA